MNLDFQDFFGLQCAKICSSFDSVCRLDLYLFEVNSLLWNTLKRRSFQVFFGLRFLLILFYSAQRPCLWYFLKFFGAFDIEWNADEEGSLSFNDKYHRANLFSLYSCFYYRMPLNLFLEYIFQEALIDTVFYQIFQSTNFQAGMLVFS